MAQELKISYTCIAPQLDEIKKVYDRLNIPPQEEKGPKGGTRAYRKIIGEKGVTPARLQITHNGVATLNIWHSNYKEWIVKQLVEHKISKSLAKKTLRLLEKHPAKRGDIVFPFLTVPPEMYGQVIKLPGVNIKFGDTSHPNNLEIELDFELERELHDVKDKVDKIHEIIMPRLRESNKVLTNREHNNIMKKVYNKFPEMVKVLERIGYMKRVKDLPPAASYWYKISGVALWNFFSFEEL